MILHWDELSKTSTSFRSPCGVWEGVIHKLLIGSKQKVLGLCLMQTIWAHYGYVHLKRRTGDAWLKRNVMSTVARNRVGCLVSRSHCCCLTVWLLCFHIAFICKEHFQKPTRDALGWTVEKRSVKECGQLQRRSWRGGKKRREHRAFITLSWNISKGSHRGNRKKEKSKKTAKEDRFDTREDLCFILHLTGMRIFPFSWQRALAPHRYPTDIYRDQIKMKWPSKVVFDGVQVAEVLFLL